VGVVIYCAICGKQSTVNHVPHTAKELTVTRLLVDEHADYFTALALIGILKW
jgi:hypothetical protein